MVHDVRYLSNINMYVIPTFRACILYVYYCFVCLLLFRCCCGVFLWGCCYLVCFQMVFLSFLFSFFLLLLFIVSSKIPINVYIYSEINYKIKCPDVLSIYRVCVNAKVMYGTMNYVQFTECPV